MALTYDLQGIQDYQLVCMDDDGTMSAVTHGLIFATMAVGIGTIDAKTAPEFYARLNLYERAMGTFTVKAGEPHYITPGEVYAHIGLKTNVFPVETRAKWMKRVFDSTLRDLARDYERTMKARFAKS